MRSIEGQRAPRSPANTGRVLKGENGYPETPDWQLPRPVVTTEPTIPPSIELGEN